MLFALPDNATLYAALLARDPTWDGRAWVGVTTTGILCRLTCPARKPKPENCTFFETAGAGLAAGFRPCKRCAPLGETDPMVTQLVDALDADPSRRWREADLVARGFDPSTVRRAFRRAFGITFLEMARQRRLAEGLTALAQGDRVIDAQIDAGFESASAFRASVARLLGHPPSALRPGTCHSDALHPDAPLRADWIATPLGPMIAVATAQALMLLEFRDRSGLPRALHRLTAKTGLSFGRYGPIDQAERELNAYFNGQSARFETPLAPQAPAFTRAVWDLLRTIPAGETRSYSELAHLMGRPTATRAVAQANGANPIALMIPCHRVLGANGALTGYGGGLWRKDRLLTLERHYADPSQPRTPKDTTDAP